MSKATQAYDYEAIVVSNTAIGCTAAKLSFTPTLGAIRKAHEIHVTVETESLRYRFDGGDPTASVGHLATAGTVIAVKGPHNLARFKMIRVGSDSAAKITYSY
jgi:hypothetical protein